MKNGMDKMMIEEHGRAIARAMSDLKVEQKKRMAKAVEKRQQMLEAAAEKALSGN